MVVHPDVMLGECLDEVFLGDASAVVRRPDQDIPDAKEFLVRNTYLVAGHPAFDDRQGLGTAEAEHTCNDVLELIEIIRQKVFENSGIQLECEVRIVD